MNASHKKSFWRMIKLRLSRDTYATRLIKIHCSPWEAFSPCFHMQSVFPSRPLFSSSSSFETERQHQQRINLHYFFSPFTFPFVLYVYHIVRSYVLFFESVLFSSSIIHLMHCVRCEERNERTRNLIDPIQIWFPRRKRKEKSRRIRLHLMLIAHPGIILGP